jgi:predicted heme/steroid binding protein
MLDAYKNIPGWFYDCASAKLDALIKEHNIKTVIEIGSFLGRSTVFFAARVEKVYAIDPFVMWEDGKHNGDAMKWSGGGQFLDKFVKNIEPVADKVVIMQTDSASAAYDFPCLEADLVYIDSNHDFESVNRDIILWLPRTKKIICGDDYMVNWPDVKKAVDLLIENPVVDPTCPLWYKIK